MSCKSALYAVGTNVQTITADETVMYHGRARGCAGVVPERVFGSSVRRRYFRVIKHLRRTYERSESVTSARV